MMNICYAEKILRDKTPPAEQIESVAARGIIMNRC